MTMPNHPDPQIQQPAPRYPMQPGGGFAPPEPKKRKKWPWIVGAFVALFVVTSVAGGGDEDEPTATASRGADSGNAAPPVEPPAAEESSATMNVPVRDGKFEFVVTGVEAGLTSLGDNPFLAEDAQGQFVIVTMTVTNIADEPKGLSPSNQKLIDAQGRSFSPDTAAALNLDSDVTFWDEINPGNTVTMPLVFDMPVDAVPSAIELHDSMFSGGVTVSLR